MRWLPQSLVARVLLHYTVTILAISGSALGIFYHYVFIQEIEEAHEAGGMLVAVAAQAIEDSVVIGDYDTVQRTLARTLVRTPFEKAAFIDTAGGVLRLANQPTESSAPTLLLEDVSRRLSDVNHVVKVGGTDYGVIRLTFNVNRVADDVWEVLLQGLWRLWPACCSVSPHCASCSNGGSFWTACRRTKNVCCRDSLTQSRSCAGMRPPRFRTPCKS